MEGTQGGEGREVVMLRERLKVAYIIACGFGGFVYCLLFPGWHDVHV